jgi:spore coat polysaccharide biosynthesis protein SpsF
VNNHCNIITVIQARMNSTRLAGKVLLPCGESTLLLKQYERVNAAEHTGLIVIATSTDKSDDVIYEYCLSENLKVFRGHPSDLLNRHLQAAVYYNGDAVVKIPSDCPLISPSVIDRVIAYFLNNPGYDYVSNLHPPSYPDGNDIEIMKLSALKIAAKEASKDFEREHTTPYLWENKDRFNIGNLVWETGLDLSMTHRWTIDYPEDYEFISKVYSEFDNNYFELEDILGLLEKKPELQLINSKYNGVNWYRHHLDELKTITPGDTRITDEEKQRRA